VLKVHLLVGAAQPKIDLIHVETVERCVGGMPALFEKEFKRVRFFKS